jgi:hypothetical protein
MPPRLDSWKISAVVRYLGDAFPGSRVEEYPRGGAVAHLFVVVAPGLDPRKRQRHNLLVTRAFFDRFSDPTSLGEALDSAGIARSLAKAGDRTIDLR